MVHADQHDLVFNPCTSNAALNGNDGDLYYSTDMNTAEPSWNSRNSGFNVTQYYNLATHPTDPDFIIAGTQDNGTHRLNSSGLTSDFEVSGGDGAFSHIHQTSPQYQLSAYVYNNIRISTNGGATAFSSSNTASSNTGRFINPSDLDDANSTLFSAGSSNILEKRTGVTTGTLTRTTYNLGFNNNQLTALECSPNNSTTLYIGEDEGNVYRIGTRNCTPTKLNTWNVSSSGYVSSIQVWDNSANTDDSILVTLSSYGVESVYVTGNGTNASPTWVDIDDNSTLQDMPVRWGIFSKEGPDRILIGTDLGVFGTESINGNSTVWSDLNNDDLPPVRVDAMEYDSDGNLVIATHGRGIWETRDPCTLKNPTIPSTAETYQSVRTVTEDGKTCFCDEDDNLLLALDTIGTGTVIPVNGVELEIGASTTTTYTTSGGIIANPDGGAIFNRKWHVAATTAPTSNVEVTYLFTDAEYNAIVATLAGLTSPTTITEPTELQLYKLTSGGKFADPHASGATGIIMQHTGSPSTTSWAYEESGDNHQATYMVSSFSGGGGGGGAGGGALPVTFLSFNVEKVPTHQANLNWKTSSELNNFGFHIERSFDGSDFTRIDFVEGAGNSNRIVSYNYLDNSIPISEERVYYRLIQEDYDGTFEPSATRKVQFEGLDNISIYPNPANTIARISSQNLIRIVEVYDASGTLAPFTFDGKNLDVSQLLDGVYFVRLGTENGYTVRRILVQH